MSQCLYVLSGVDKIDKVPKNTKAVLLSTPNINKNKSFVDKLLNRNNILRMLDSGGNQIYNINNGKSKDFNKFISVPNKPIHQGNTLNLHPTHLNTTSEIYRPNIMIALDNPVGYIKDEKEQELLFQAKIQQNIDWAVQSIKIRNQFQPETKIFLPFQGYTLEHLDYFLSSLGRNFDGLSLPMRCFKDTKILLKFLLHIRNYHGIKKIHLLGSSRFDVVILCSYLTAINYFEFISYDSSTPAIDARNLHFTKPYDLRAIHVKDVKKAMLDNNCDCDICKDKLSNINFNEMTFDKDGIRLLRKLLLEHNYNAIENLKQMVNYNAKSVSKIEKILRRYSDRKDLDSTIQMIKSI